MSIQMMVKFDQSKSQKQHLVKNIHKRSNELAILFEDGDNVRLEYFFKENHERGINKYFIEVNVSLDGNVLVNMFDMSSNINKNYFVLDNELLEIKKEGF